MDPDLFVTLFLAELDPQTRTLRHVGAGHRSYRLRACGEITLLDSTCLPLGMERDPIVSHPEATALEAGDVVVFLTDGIVEAVTPEGDFFGIHRALQLVQAHREQSAHRIVEALYSAARTYANDDRQHDDITAVILKVGPPP